MQRLQLRRLEAELAGRTTNRAATDDAQLFAQRTPSVPPAARRSSTSKPLKLPRATLASRQLDAGASCWQKLETTCPAIGARPKLYAKLAASSSVGTLQVDERRREALEKA